MWAASLSTLVGYLFLFIYRIIDLRKYHKLTINNLHIILWVGVLVAFSIVSFINNTVCNYVIFVLGLGTFVYLNRKLISAIMKKLLK